MSRLGKNMCQWHTIATVTAYEFLIFAHRLMILYICTKICENISKCFRLLSEHNLHTEIYQEGIIIENYR